MNAKELATLLNGRNYGEEITAEEAEKAKQSGLVVVFGASDDLMEFRGAINDEIGAYEGTTAYITRSGLLENQCECEDCHYFEQQKDMAAKIIAKWNELAEESDSWAYELKIPHEKFNIYDGEEIYCQGIVFALSDVPIH